MDAARVGACARASIARAWRCWQRLWAALAAIQNPAALTPWQHMEMQQQARWWHQSGGAEHGGHCCAPPTTRVVRATHNVGRKGGSMRLREVYLRGGEDGLLVPLCTTTTAATTTADSSDHGGFWDLPSQPAAPSITTYLAPDAASLVSHLEVVEGLTDALRGGSGGSGGSAPGVALLVMHSALAAAADGMSQRERGRLQKVLQASPGSLLYINDYSSDGGGDGGGGDNGDGTAAAAFVEGCGWCAHALAAQGARAASPPPPTVLMLSDDLDALSHAAAAADGAVRASTWEAAMAAHFSGALQLQALARSCTAAARESAAAAAAEAAASAAAVSDDGAGGAAGGMLCLEGTLRIFRHNPREGTVLARGPGEPSRNVLISGRDAMSHAFDGDTVALRLLPRSRWRAPEASRRLTAVAAATTDDDGGREGDGTDGGAVTQSSSGGSSVASGAGGDVMPTGVIVRIVRAGRRRFVATIPAEEASRGSSGSEASVLAVPMDPRVPKIKLRTRQLGELMGRRLLVEADTWEGGARWPAGHYVRSLGRVGRASTEVAALLHECGAAFGPFSARALACLPAVPTPPFEPQAPRPVGASSASDDSDSDGGGGGASAKKGRGRRAHQHREWRDSGWRPAEEEVTARLDLRTSRRVFSVDPPGCQDIDDAMHIHHLPLPQNGGDKVVAVWEVGVHIADVTHFVAHGSALDVEARARGTTTYLPHRRYDMLPALLASDVCSLHGGRDRLALSVLWTVEQLDDGRGARSETFRLPTRGDGTIEARFARTAIHSSAAMTYCQAHALLSPEDGGGGGGLPEPQVTVPAGQAGAPVPPHLHAPLAGDLAALTRLARSLRAQRTAGGALDLTRSEGELKFTIDATTGLPSAVAAAADMEIHHTIAELMILANRTVAEATRCAFPRAALLRTHAPVAADRLGELAAVAAAAGVALGGGSGGGGSSSGGDGAMVVSGGGGSGGGVSGAALQAALQRGEAARGAGVGALLKSLATRVMSEALYVCTGALDEHGSGGGGGDGDGDSGAAGRLSHFGLGIGNYTHFTSPIRRYADVVVHRLLLATMGVPYPAVAPPTPPLLPPSTSAAAAAAAAEEDAAFNAGVAIPASLAPSVLPGSAEALKTSEEVAHLMPAIPDVGGGGAAGGKAAAAKPAQQQQSELDDLDGDDLIDALLGGDDSDEDTSGGGGGGGGGGATSYAAAAAAAAAAEAAAAPEDSGVTAMDTTGDGATDGGDWSSTTAGGGDGGDGTAVSVAPPFGTLALEGVCRHLNDRTRTAKHLSHAAQELFLRLHFMNCVRTVDAVVFSLKANGFLAYVPAFDTKGPVFLTSRDGTVNINPRLLSLSVDAGEAPSQGFEVLPGARALPSARLVLTEDSGDGGGGGVLTLEGGGGGKSLQFTVPMVVTLHVTCDVQPGKARLPDLRFGLAAIGARGAAPREDFESRRTDTAAMAAAAAAAAAIDATAATVASGKENRQQQQRAVAAATAGGGEAPDSMIWPSWPGLGELPCRIDTLPADTPPPAPQQQQRKPRRRAADGLERDSSARGRISFGGFHTQVTAQDVVFQQFGGGGGGDEYASYGAGGGGDYSGGGGGDEVAAAAAELGYNRTQHSVADWYTADDGASGGGGGGSGWSARLSMWDDSAERRAQATAMSRQLREGAKRRQYTRPKN